MADYIERRAFKDKYLCCGYLPEMSEKEFDEFPTANVAPVVHGRWEPRQDVKGFVRCSNCKDCNICDDWADGKKWRYCPNCGAKMGGGK